MVQSSNYYLWCGTEICEVRDGNGATVLRRLFPQGEALLGASGSTNYFYTRDHLGSVREAVGANGLLATRYSYDPFGQKSVIQEYLQTTFDFTGDLAHQKSGLYLTWFRALDSTHGRWLSRDPSGEAVGINLYEYVTDNPLSRVDHFGLCEGGHSCDAKYKSCLNQADSLYHANLNTLSSLIGWLNKQVNDTYNIEIAWCSKIKGSVGRNVCDMVAETHKHLASGDVDALDWTEKELFFGLYLLNVQECMHERDDCEANY
jgi:RHS repeat-associated protein